MDNDFYYVNVELVNYILSNDPTIGQLNTNIFIDYIPKDPDNMIGFVEYQGSAIATFTNTSVRSVQCWVRNTKNISAQHIAWEVFNLLKPGDPIIELENVTALISMRSTPYRLKTDDYGRSVWTFNMGVTFNYKPWNPNEFK